MDAFIRGVYGFQPTPAPLTHTEGQSVTGFGRNGMGAETYNGQDFLRSPGVSDAAVVKMFAKMRHHPPPPSPEQTKEQYLEETRKENERFARTARPATFSEFANEYATNKILRDSVLNTTKRRTEEILGLVVDPLKHVFIPDWNPKPYFYIIAALAGVYIIMEVINKTT